jgi:rsbT co-antagonist protein RsbR
MEQVIDAFRSATPAIVDELTDQLIAEQIETYAALPRDRLHQLSVAVVDALGRDLAEDTPRHFPGYWEQVAGLRAEQGGQIDEILRAVEIGEAIVDAHLQAALAGDAEARVWWVGRLHKIIHHGVIALVRIFINAHEQLIRNQALQIRELSVPIIPLHTGILVLPLVGAIDSHRAGQVMEALLEGVAREQAEVVIVDITGVPVVDTGVGNHLIQAARAAQLLGAQVVLVGISAEIAQTMVQLGIDLTRIVTRANLQSGIEYAFGLHGLVIRAAGA